MADPRHRKRRRSRKLDVVNMPPPWRRSLTESGMTRAPTRVDRIAVAILLLAVLAGAIWIVTRSL